MAGITDQPFRNLCLQHGAGMTVAEMVTSNSELWGSEKNRLRLSHDGSRGIRVIQIAGSDAQLMAQAARLNVNKGAQIIDINMGCPAKKVLKKAAGSALLKDTALVSQILKSVVTSVDVPVTLKIRTGWSRQTRNGVEIAQIAESEGIQALSVHGRTRECRFLGTAEFDTIAAIKQAVNIPVIANGDITSPQTAKRVMDYTQVDGIMIGRGAQGQPWIFREIDYYLRTGNLLESLPLEEVRETILTHLSHLYPFYGEFKGVLIARKHVGWYMNRLSGPSHFRKEFNTLSTSKDQVESINRVFDSLINCNEEIAA